MTKSIHRRSESFFSQEEGTEFMMIDCDLENIIISIVLKKQFLSFCIYNSWRNFMLTCRNGSRAFSIQNSKESIVDP